MNQANHSATQSDASDYDRLFYPFLFDGGQVSAQEVLEQVRQSTLQKCQEVSNLRRTTLEQCQDVIVMAGQEMATAFANGATLFAMGNGGSATDVQDLVADLMAPPVPCWSPLPAMTLTNDVAVVTAIGNDVGFENIFSRQVIAFGRPGDIVVGFSTSGNSRNVLTAFEQAKKQELLTIGLAGYDGGAMARSAAVDYCIVVPSEYIPRIQEAQATVYHCLLEIVQTCLDGR